MKLKTRLIALCTTGLAAIAGVGAWVHSRLYHPIGTGPAGPPVAREPFAKPWHDRPTLLLGLGDSVTDGYGATKGHSYFERLVENPPDEWADMKGLCLRAVLPKLTVLNAAVSGSTSLQHIETIRRLPVRDDVEAIVTITTGGNDLIHNYGRTPPREGAMFGASWDQAQPWVAAFEKRLDEMMALLKQKFPRGCRVFLANIYDPTDGEGDIGTAGLPDWDDGVRLLDAYNAVIERVAKRNEHVRLVDMRGVMLGHGIHCRQSSGKHYDAKDPHYWYFSNLEDPNDRGYDAIRREFLNAIRGALEGKR